MADDLCRVSKDNWKYRRRVVFGSLLFIAIAVICILYRAFDSALYRDGLVALIGAGVVIITGYVFGAVWDDNFKRRYLDGDKR